MTDMHKIQQMTEMAAIPASNKKLKKEPRKSQPKNRIPLTQEERLATMKQLE